MLTDNKGRLQLAAREPILRPACDGRTDDATLSTSAVSVTELNSISVNYTLKVNEDYKPMRRSSAFSRHRDIYLQPIELQYNIII